MVGDENDQNSFYSDGDEQMLEEMNEKKVARLSMVSLYGNSHFPVSLDCQYDNLKDSALFAKQFITILLKHTNDQIYENYLNKRRDKYAAVFSMSIAERMVEMDACPTDLDQTKIELLEDDEPLRPVEESWQRSKVGIERTQDNREPLKKQDQRSLTEIASINHNKHYSKPSRVDTTTSQKSEGSNKLINMEKLQEIDEFIERLRVMKADEIKRKVEKEEMNKKDKQINPLELKKEQKNLKFTYDFDGKLLTTKPIKTEKLPPQNYAPIFNFSSQDQSKQKKQVSSNGEQDRKLTLAQQQNEINQNSKITSQGVGQQKVQIATQPFNFDEFSLSQGVTIIYEQRTKEGPKKREKFDNLEMLDNRFKMSDDPVQITKTEYKKLTENGNMILKAAILTVNPQIEISNFQKRNKSLGVNVQKQPSVPVSISASPMVSQKQKQLIEVPSKENIKSSSNYNQSNGLSSTILGNILNPIEQVSSPSNGIKVARPVLMKQIIDLDNSSDIKLENRIKLPVINGYNSFDLSKQVIKSPVDDFNQSIVKGNPDWGKGRGGGIQLSNSSILPPTRSSQKLLRTTLNQFYKKPRERDWTQSFKLSKSSNPKNVFKFSKEETDTLDEGQFRGTFYTHNHKFSETLRSFKN